MLNLLDLQEIFESSTKLTVEQIEEIKAKKLKKLKNRFIGESRDFAMNIANPNRLNKAIFEIETKEIEFTEKFYYDVEKFESRLHKVFSDELESYMKNEFQIYIQKKQITNRLFFRMIKLTDKIFRFELSLINPNDGKGKWTRMKAYDESKFYNKNTNSLEHIPTTTPKVVSNIPLQ